MRTLMMSLTTVMLVSLLLVAGCAVNSVRDMMARGGAGSSQGLGKTILVCQVAFPARTGPEREKVQKIATLGGEALEAVPDARRVPAEALLTRLSGRDPAGLCDPELAAAALDAGADTVVLVQVTGYGGELKVSLLPPYWMVTTDFAYHARVIDARTGALYLDAYRGRKSGGAFNALGPADLARAFKTDLADLLAGAAERAEGS